MTDDRQPDDTPLAWASAWLTGTVRNAEDLDLEEAWTVWVVTHREWRERVAADLGLPEELADPEPDEPHWHWQECAPDVIGELRGSLPDDLTIDNNTDRGAPCGAGLSIPRPC